MHVRRRTLSGGAVLAATASIVLGAAPAQADCSLDNGAENAARWHVGAQLGPAPVQLTGTGGPLAALLYVLPQGEIAVEDAAGHNLVRLDTASVRTRTESPAPPDDLGLPDPVGGVRVHETDRTRAADAEAEKRAAGNRSSPTAARVDAAAAPKQTQLPLRADGANNTLASPFTWVPIEFGAFGQDGAGVPWTSGIALVVLGAGVAGVTVVARRGRVGAG